MKLSQAEASALQYLNRGWSVIPLRPQEKRPCIRWLEFQQRRAGVEEVRGWFQQWPAANVGIVTGIVSGLVVLDIDPKHGGEESLSRLERMHAPLPRTVEAETGGGGRHLYFSHPGDSVQNRVGLFPGIDLRGDGGYIVAPPSLHVSGKPYQWASLRDPGNAPLAWMPDWLLREIQASKDGAGHPPQYWRRLVREGVAEGERNNTLASFTGHLLRHGVDPEVVMELMLSWNTCRCRPPLPDEEVARTVDSIVRLHQRHEEER